jgi:hypothetical protein
MARFVSSGSYIEFEILERGPDGHAQLSIKVDSSYDEMFIFNLKRNTRHDVERWWDGDSKLWFIAPAVLDKVIELAKVCYRSVIQIHGDEAVDLLTGELIPMTGSLFA